MLIRLLAAVFVPCSAGAAADSVAVLFRPEKVLVQVNEAGSVSRLQEFMNVLQAGADLSLLSSDESVKVSCGRNREAASCVFRFLPSPSVAVGDRKVQAVLPLSGSIAGVREWSFESSRGDRFVLRTEPRGLVFMAGKKGAL